MWKEFKGKYKGKQCTSISECNAYAQCPMKHYKEKVLRNRQNSPHFAFGRAFDKVVEDRLLSIINGQPPPSMEQSLSMWDGVFSKEWDALKEEEKWGVSEEEMRIMGPAHVKIFHEQVEDLLDPLAVQYQFYWNIYGDIWLRGDLDYVDKRKFFIDWKTAGKSPPANWVHRKAAAKDEGLSIDTSAFKKKWNKENPNDTLIDPQYRMQILTYAAGLWATGALKHYNEAYLFNFIKSVKSPSLVKQRIYIDDLDKNLMDIGEMLIPVIMGIESNYMENGEQPLKLGKFIKSPYGGGVCDSCHVKNIEGGRCGRC